MTHLFGGSYTGKRVFVTGHTGFKGSWLTLWLRSLGADVTGYSLPPPTVPSMFDIARVVEGITHIEADVRDATRLNNALVQGQPAGGRPGARERRAAMCGRRDYVRQVL